MFLKKSLIYKQVFYFLIVATSILFSLGAYFYYYSKHAIIERTYDQLTSVRETKKNQIKYFFSEKINETEFLASSKNSELLYYDLISKKANPSEKFKENLGFNEFGFINIHYCIRDKQEGNFTYLHLINDTVTGIKDYPATQIIETMWHKIALGSPFEMSDYVRRYTQDTTPVIFMGFPFLIDTLNTKTIIIFEISSNFVTNTLIQYSAEKGFGNSGEAYLVGSDFKMRSHSRFIENAILNISVESNAAKEALKGNAGKMITKDYRGIEVYSSYTPLEVYGNQWAILSEIDYTEVMKPIKAMRNDLIFLSIIIYLFITSISIFLSLTIVKPIRKLEKAATSIGEGNFEISIENKSSDEIGSLTATFNKMASDLKLTTKELKEREQRLHHFYQVTLEGILIHDESKPILVNKALTEMTGYNEIELLNNNINHWLLDYKTNEDLYETILIKKTGDKIHVEIKNNQLPMNNQIVNASIIRDISIRKEAEEKDKLERKARLTALYDGQEMERQRISRELHDGMGQQLVGIKLKIENILSQNKEQENKIFVDIKTNLASSIEELRRISYNLRPPVLTELGLIAAVGNLCKEFENTSLIKCDFSSFGQFENITLSTSSYLYRICQEALNNISKHAKATEANIQIIENKTEYILIIEDNGIGFEYDSSNISKGNGLFNMHERAMLLNGKISIESILNEGTTIRIKIPKSKV